MGAAPGKRVLDSFMTETNGGGSPENVPGFDIRRAITSGFQSRLMVGPTILAARPDGGYFADSEPSDGLVGVSAAKRQNVVGVDNRVRVPETSAAPWRCICQLEIEYDRGPVGLGTGFLIGERTVITAAHVLVEADFVRQSVRTARQVRVVPGRNGEIAPFGYVVSDTFERPPIWCDPLKDEVLAGQQDYAAIILPEEGKLGERIGYFGLEVLDNIGEKNRTVLLVNNAGYPLTPNRPYGTLWYNAGRIHKVQDCFIDYMIDTEGGQSGSPIYYYEEASRQRRVVAIHTLGDFVNRGLKITPEIFDQIRAWAGR